MLIDGLKLCGLLVDYCDVFISCLDSQSDGTHSLQRIHWWTSDVMLHFSKSVLMKKQTHLLLECPQGEYILRKLNFWVNYPFKNILYLIGSSDFLPQMKWTTWVSFDIILVIVCILTGQQYAQSKNILKVFYLHFYHKQVWKVEEDAVSRTYQCFVKMSTLSRFTHMRVCFQCVRIFMDQLSFCYLVIKCVNRVKKGPSGMIHLWATPFGCDLCFCLKASRVHLPTDTDSSSLQTHWWIHSLIPLSKSTRPGHTVPHCRPG